MSLEKHTGAVGTRMMCEEEMLRNAYVNLGASFGQKKLTRTINKYTADCELKLKMDRERNAPEKSRQNLMRCSDDFLIF